MSFGVHNLTHVKLHKTIPAFLTPPDGLLAGHALFLRRKMSSSTPRIVSDPRSMARVISLLKNVFSLSSSSMRRCAWWRLYASGVIFLHPSQ